MIERDSGTIVCTTGGSSLDPLAGPAEFTATAIGSGALHTYALKLVRCASAMRPSKTDHHCHPTADAASSALPPTPCWERCSPRSATFARKPRTPTRTSRHT